MPANNHSSRPKMLFTALVTGSKIVKKLLYQEANSIVPWLC